MNKTVLLLPVFMISSCASSMAPSQFIEKLTLSTKSVFYDKQNANEVLSNGNCKLITEGRKYTSPIGRTVNGDLQNGAVGVDEWVEADKGNAYILNNFEWVYVLDNATQLIIYFDTMICK